MRGIDSPFILSERQSNVSRNSAINAVYYVPEIVDSELIISALLFKSNCCQLVIIGKKKKIPVYRLNENLLEHLQNVSSRRRISQHPLTNVKSWNERLLPPSFETWGIWLSIAVFLNLKKNVWKLEELSQAAYPIYVHVDRPKVFSLLSSY